MKKAKFILTVTLAGLTGLIIGSTASFLICNANPEKVNFEKHHAMMLEKIIKELDMDKAQIKKFYDIHNKYIDKSCKVLKPVKTDLTNILEAEKKEVESILSPEQCEKFHQIRNKQIDNFKLKFANAELLKKQVSGN